MREVRDIISGRRTAIALVAITGLAASGCGGDDEPRANVDRPPAQIVVTAAVTKDGISVSPKAFGAGPVSLVVTNLTDSAQQVTFESSGSAAGFTQQTGPINPSDTARLQANVPEGPAVVRVQSRDIKPAEVEVGESRPSAQDDLLLP